MDVRHIDIGHAIAVEVAKSTPRVLVTAWLTAGGDMDFWIKVLTVVFLVLQIAYLVFAKPWKNKKGTE